MRFLPPLRRGVLVRRYKRFLADIQLDDGPLVTAHCPNPGAMTSSAVPGRPAWVSPADAPHRKLRWTWQLARPRRALVLVNTHLANPLVRVGVERGRVPELSGYGDLRSEVVFPDGEGRVDHLLVDADRPPCWVEVKSVTLRMDDGVARFPDSITKRGTRHLEALMRVVKGGHRGVLFFLVGRADAGPVAPASHIDPVYADTLRRAAEYGVEVLAYRARLGTKEVGLGPAVPIALDA